MSFSPVIPSSGLTGLRFLQSTYDRQIEAFGLSASVQNDIKYTIEKLSNPITVDELIDDSRLLRTTLTAFGLQGEETKQALVRKVIEENTNPESTFLARLNNRQYTAYADAFKPVDGVIAFDTEAVNKIIQDFVESSFEIAIGEQDESLRLALNYEAEISEIVGEGSSDLAIAYRILGDEPIRAVLETALNLPTEFAQLDIDRQASILQEKLQSAFGISNLSDLANPDEIDAVITRFQVIESINSGPSASTPGAAALTLLTNGLGAQASANLILSALYD